MFIEDAATHVLNSCAGGNLPSMKLHTLLYYCQAWSLAFDNKALFDEDFHAWVHGPVNPVLWKTCALRRPGLSVMSIVDVELVDGQADNISTSERYRIDSVLESYAGLSMFALSDLVRAELPWQQARGENDPAASCSASISRLTMRGFYLEKYRLSLLTQA